MQAEVHAACATTQQHAYGFSGPKHLKDCQNEQPFSCVKVAMLQLIVCIITRST